MGHLRKKGEAIKVYETVAGTRIDREKSVGMQRSTCRGKSILSDSVVGRWTEGSVKLLGGLVRAGPPIEKNWTEVSNKVTIIVRT